MPKISALPGLLAPTLDDLFVCVDTALTPTMHTDKVLISTMLTLFEDNIEITDANFSGVLGLNHGGTNAALVASNGSIVYSTATEFALLATQNSSVLVTTNAGIPVQSGPLTNGQLIIGSSGATPVVGSLTAGANISITPGAGTITIAASGAGSSSWVVETTTSRTLTPFQYVIPNNVGLVTLTIPATCAVGDEFQVAGLGSGGWLVRANTNQTINLGNTPTTVAGSLASTNRYDSIRIVCTVANTTLVVVGGPQGAITVA